MRVKEAELARAVAEASSGADDPQRAATLVGAFMRRQPMVGHYVSSHLDELKPEGMVLTLLHASVMARAVELAVGYSPRALDAQRLDAAARSHGAAEGGFAEAEPELDAYLEGNLAPDDPQLEGPRRALVLRLLRVIGRALVDQAG